MHTRYIVTGPVARIGSSESLFLSAPQADARRHALTEEGKGVYSAIQPLEFKSGEMIGLTVKPEELPRYLGDTLRPATREEIKAADAADREWVKQRNDAADRGQKRFAAEKVAAREKAAAKKTKAVSDRQAAEAAAREKAEADRRDAEAKALAEREAGGGSGN